MPSRATTPRAEVRRLSRPSSPVRSRVPALGWRLAGRRQESSTVPVSGWLSTVRNLFLQKVFGASSVGS